MENKVPKREVSQKKHKMDCVISEDILTLPTEGIGNSREEGYGGILKEFMKFNWNFQRGGGHRANPFC